VAYFSVLRFCPAFSSPAFSVDPPKRIGVDYSCRLIWAHSNGAGASIYDRRHEQQYTVCMSGLYAVAKSAAIKRTAGFRFYGPNVWNGLPSAARNNSVYSAVACLSLPLCLEWY